MQRIPAIVEKIGAQMLLIYGYECFTCLNYMLGNRGSEWTMNQLVMKKMNESKSNTCK
jgi:hypothetical protein